MEFYVGQTLICIDPVGALNLGAVYTCDAVFSGYIGISETGGTYYPTRFRPLNENSPYQEWESKNIKRGAA
jgi:hypothetical protein